jgi:hypothetical protein
MLNRFCSMGGCAVGMIDDCAVSDPVAGAAATDRDNLPSDEVERLIVLCEAPALLWRPEPAPAREPEPFGMIA